MRRFKTGLIMRLLQTRGMILQRRLQGLAKLPFLELVSFDPDVAYHFCLILPECNMGRAFWPSTVNWEREGIHVTAGPSDKASISSKDASPRSLS